MEKSEELPYKCKIIAVLEIGEEIAWKDCLEDKLPGSMGELSARYSENSEKDPFMADAQCGDAEESVSKT